MAGADGSGTGAVQERGSGPSRWWVGEGPRSCPWCLQGYAVEVERRCVACDRPGCLHCVLRVRVRGLHRVHCPECGAEASASDAVPATRS